MDKIWKDIKGYEGLYKISECGDIKKLDSFIFMPNGGRRIDNEKILVAHKNHKGYLQIRLSNAGARKTFIVHRLVALHFVPNPKNKPQVNHKDCNKLNNRFTNLEWCTNVENCCHAVINGLIKSNPKSIATLVNYSKSATGSKNNNATKVAHIRTGKTFGSTIEAAKEFGLTHSQMQKRLKKGKEFVRIHTIEEFMEWYRMNVEIWK